LDDSNVVAHLEQTAKNGLRYNPLKFILFLMVFHYAFHRLKRHIIDFGIGVEIRIEKGPCIYDGILLDTLYIYIKGFDSPFYVTLPEGIATEYSTNSCRRFIQLWVSRIPTFVVPSAKIQSLCKGHHRPPKVDKG